MSWILTSSPIPGHGPWDQESWNESRSPRVHIVQIGMLSDEWLSRYVKFETLQHKTLMQCDANADNPGDYNSSPYTSYRQANKYLIYCTLKITQFANPSLMCGLNVFSNLCLLFIP